MKTYIINIATLAKKEDAYNEVVTNLYPIVIKTYDESHLRKHLMELSDKIKETLKNKYLYMNAQFYVRTIEGEEFTIRVPDVVKLEYT